MTKTRKLPKDHVLRARQLIEAHGDELRLLLTFCGTRDSRDEGVPAVLIVDDFTREDKPYRVPALADEAFRSHYADMALALAILVEAGGGDPDYPSICPAMSAIAEQAFGTLPFRDQRNPGED